MSNVRRQSGPPKEHDVSVILYRLGKSLDHVKHGCPIPDPTNDAHHKGLIKNTCADIRNSTRKLETALHSNPPKVSTQEIQEIATDKLLDAIEITISSTPNLSRSPSVWDAMGRVAHLIDDASRQIRYDIGRAFAFAARYTRDRSTINNLESPSPHSLLVELGEYERRMKEEPGTLSLTDDDAVTLHHALIMLIRLGATLDVAPGLAG